MALRHNNLKEDGSVVFMQKSKLHIILLTFTDTVLFSLISFAKLIYRCLKLET